MCGIFCIFANSDVNITEKLSKIFQEFNLNISRRGPNQSKIEICHNEDQIFLFAASILWLQGSKLTKQPVNDKEHIFVYNGDVFNDDTENSRNTHGDTKLFLDHFKSTEKLESLFHTNGPFAFICLDKSKSTLYFGRDKYGRRSLLIGKHQDQIILSSVAKRNTNFKFIEVPSLGLFSINFKEKKITLRPWFSENSNFSNKLKELCEFLNQNIDVQSPICKISSISNFIQPTVDDLNLYESLRCFDKDNILQFISSKQPKIVQELKNHLMNSVKRRISNQPKFCQDCIREQKYCRHALVGVLFSGGIDCAIIALLADNFVEEDRPIDLLNVAFLKNDSIAPDRITGLQTLEELKKLCPNRKWNFIEINVSFAELDKERDSKIADLIFPLNTILDDSLGCALWFASRGVTNNYVSTCRVLLVGMGADELFGGYTRHRAAFKNNGWLGLHNVLTEDWENLPYRNLGRDDRVVSDHGRQLRTPYLDEDVVNFVQSLNCWERTMPSEEIPQEVGPKYLLRTLAFSMGLEKAAMLKKRALQFGSKIANPKENAHEVSPRLL